MKLLIWLSDYRKRTRISLSVHLIPSTDEANSAIIAIYEHIYLITYSNNRNKDTKYNSEAKTSKTDVS